MKISIAFKNIKSSDAVEERIHTKAEKIERYFGEKGSIKWHCHKKNGVYLSEVNVLGPKVNFHAKAHSDNLYKSFDLVADKIGKQVQKKNDKLKQNIHHKHDHEIEILDPENAWLDYDEDYIEDAS